MKDNGWTIRSTGWQTKGVRSVANQNIVGEMTFLGNRERYGQG